MKTASALFFILLFCNCNNEASKNNDKADSIAQDTSVDHSPVYYQSKNKKYSDSVDSAIHAGDSVILDSTYLIRGNNFRFYVFREIEQTLLTITKTTDSTPAFQQPLYADWGDCNARTKIKGKYFLHADTLIYYIHTTDIDMFDFQNQHSQSRMRKEIYIFRANGDLVRTGIAETKNQDDKLWSEVEDKLGE